MRIRRGDIYKLASRENPGADRMGVEAAGQMERVLVIQNDIGNEFGPNVIVAAISGSAKRAYPFNVKIPRGIIDQPSEVCLHQIGTLDKTRLGDRLARIPKDAMSKVDEALTLSLGLPRIG